VKIAQKLTVLTLLILLLTGTLTGCTFAPATLTPPPTPTPSPVTLTYPGEDWGYPSPLGFYPRGPGYLRMSFLFDTLTWKDENGIIPWLADSWQVSEDGTRWTFKLHPGVKWHDGEPLTADDVAFTFDYLKAYQQSFKWFVAVSKVTRTEVVDDLTIVIETEKPVAGFLVDVAGSVPIMPRHIWEDVQDPARFAGEQATVGTGPFTLVEYNKEEARYIYQANPDYFKGKPMIDQLVFIKVQDEATALKTGTVDAASFWGKEIDVVKEIENDPNFQYIDGPSYWVLQIIFNSARSPLDQVEFRQAIVHAVDRAKIVEQVTHGGAIVANLGIVSPNSEWYNPNLPVYEYDPEKAQNMLEQIGAAGTNLTLITTGGFAREAELIKADLEQVGLGVEIKTGDRGTIDGLLREGNFDLAINGHGGIANPTILNNPTWPAAIYHNEAYDALFAEQGATVDEAQRRELVWQLQQMLVEDLPVLTIYHPRMWCVYNPDKLDTWFYTPSGIATGIPIELNKLIFLER